MASVIVIGGPAEGQVFALENHKLVMVGRDQGASFQIVDPRISRFHMQFKRLTNSDRHMLIDFESANGVRVNGRKIEGELVLSDGDQIAIGDTTMVYTFDDKTDAQTVQATMRRYGQGFMATQPDPSKTNPPEQ